MPIRHLRSASAPRAAAEDHRDDGPAADHGADGASAEGQGDVHQAHAAPASRWLDVAGSVVALVVGVLLYVLARDIDVRTETGGIDPRWWPQVLGAAAIAVSALLLVVTVLRRPVPREGVEAATTSGRLRLGLTVLLTVVYVVVWPLIGFLPATLGLLVGVVGVFGGRGVRALVAFPVLLTAAIYLVFHTLLAVPL